MELIPVKQSLTKKEIENNLKLPHGVKIAYNNDEEIGLSVWYEKDSVPYLWLGAYRIRGMGFGSKVLEEIMDDLRDMGYETLIVKTGKDTVIANRQLEKYGFRRVQEDERMYLWEKTL
jgi:GNAT superfamily N-acetyltransferase